MSDTTGAPRRIESATLQERVYRELAHSIMTGHYAPGEALTIRALAADLGTSVMPVREALQRLYSDGAVVVTPKNMIVADGVFSTLGLAETAFLLVSEEVPGFKPQRSRLIGSKEDWPSDTLPSLSNRRH